MAGKKLNMENVKQIQLMQSQGTPIKEIARRLGLSKNTVKKYLREATIEPTDAILPEHFRKLPRQTSENYRQLEAMFPEISKWLEGKDRGVTLYICWERYKGRYPNGYSKSQFYSYYRKYNKTQHAVMHINQEYGDKLYIDYAGKKVHYTDLQHKERIECEFFLTVLSGSQEAYAEATHGQTKDEFIESVQNALIYYGGCPKVLVPDNLKSAITQANKYEPKINATFMEMANHYGCAVMPARSRRPRDKALVERYVSILYTRIYTELDKRQFYSLTELNQAIWELLELHNLTPFQNEEYSRRTLFSEYERTTLSALPAQRFEIREYAMLTVMKNCHVRFSPDKNYYSVPYRFIGEKVKLAVSCHDVEIFLGNQRIALHKRSRNPHQYTSVKDHLPSSHQFVSEWNPDKFINWAHGINPVVEEYIRLVLEQKIYPEILYRSCVGILQFDSRCGRERLVKACSKGLSLRVYTYGFIARTLKNKAEDIPLEVPVEIPDIEHDNIRGADYYKQNKTT